MTTMTDEELKQFLKENMSRIQEILADDYDCAKDVAKGIKDDLGVAKDGLKESVSEKKDAIKEKVSEKKDKAEDTVKEIYSAVMDPAAHKHFVRMGLELALGIEAVMQKMPVPDMIRKFREDVEESKEGIQKELCKVNDNCQSKAKPAEPEIEVIEIE